MLPTLIIVFREVLEAGLIVGIVLAATTSVPRRGRWIAGGILAGVLGSAIVAGFAGAISQALEGMGQEIFTASILLLAVAMLSWHNIWMATHGRELARQARALAASVSSGDRSLAALAIVVFVAVLREGSEVVLFLYGIAVSSHDSAATMLAGGAAGVAAGAGVSFLLYRGLLAIPVRHLFTVTHWMIALLAAGMAAQAAALLASDDLLPSWGSQLWDLHRILPDDGVIGRPLHVLVGYADRPSGIQLAAWLATLVFLAVAERWVRGRAPTATAS
ncbi:MAG TPA: FTR1 family protein [Stellaceae bacterium]|nr:FTR1 family protein [Stellaceae bacterium]